MLVVVNYHYVRTSFEAPHPGIFGVTPEALEHQLSLVGRVGTYVSASQVREAAGGGSALPARSLLVTFDDGLREQVETALPILDRLGIPALFFVNTAPLAEERLATVHQIHFLRSRTPPAAVLELLREAARDERLELDLRAADREGAAREQYPYDDDAVAALKYFLNFRLGWRERRHLVDRAFEARFPGRTAAIARDLYADRDVLRRLAARGALGTHAHEHLPLARLARSEIETQVRRSLDLLEAWTGHRPSTLSYPYGGPEACSPTVARIAEDAGIELAFTMERRPNPDLREPLLLGRFDCNDLPGGKSPLVDIDEIFLDLPTRRASRPVVSTA